ncbi:MAG: hypothetical protein VYC34_02935 [Planctomycetota bacterium]|nr:hypothetical protein [Planctomycetota bacterium]
MTNFDDQHLGQGSLLDELDAAPPGKTKAPKAKREVSAFEKKARWIGAGLALSGLLASAAIAWGGSLGSAPPDPFADPFDNVLAYTLLDKNFNRLPLEERMALIKQIAERLGSLDGGDSALMAAFAAGISGEARRQLQENISVLGMDILDKFAREYAASDHEDPNAAMEDALRDMIDLTQELRTLAGDQPRRSTDETIDLIRRQSEREAEREQQAAGSSLDDGEVDEVFDWVQNDVNQYASPNERARVTRFMRDATRFMQGRDVRTGKPMPK